MSDSEGEAIDYKKYWLDKYHEAIKERDQYKRAAIDLAKYARLQQLRGNFPTTAAKRDIADTLKNEWRFLDEWHRNLPSKRMNWLNQQLAEALRM